MVIRKQKILKSTIKKTKKQQLNKNKPKQQYVKTFPKVVGTNQKDTYEKETKKSTRKKKQQQQVTGTQLFVIDTPDLKPKLVPWTVPQEMATLKCGHTHTLIIPEYKQHMCYVTGRNNLGQCGIGMNHQISHHAEQQRDQFGPPVPAPYLKPPKEEDKIAEQAPLSFPERLKWPMTSKITHLGVGKDHTIWCIDNEMIFSTGWNTRGQCGVGTKYNVYVPTKVDIKDHKVKIVACGDSHSFVVTQSQKEFNVSDTLFAFGSNRQGQLALDNPTYYTTPTKVDHPILDDLVIQNVICSANSTFILSSDGNLYGFGQNRYGELGLGHRVQVDAPQIIRAGLATETTGVVTHIAAGAQHAVYVVDDRHIFMAGSNAAHQLGIDKREVPYTLRFQPFTHELLENKVIRKVVCGRFCTAILTHDNLLFVFGSFYGPFQESNFIEIQHLKVNDIGIQNDRILLICKSM
mmetsp:Transcript_255/g.466  ORF Transcript_255/g.466 Transcript_255/m.466 type:complete len:462 (+) Transcript_255:61-1446(+)